MLTNDMILCHKKLKRGRLHLRKILSTKVILVPDHESDYHFQYLVTVGQYDTFYFSGFLLRHDFQEFVARNCEEK